MWLRRGLRRWLLPAALVLPLWLLVGWGIFSGGAGTLLSVLLILAPAVLVGELLIALLVRLRPSVRAARAVSWRDALGIVVWHGLIVAVGCFVSATFGVVVVIAALAYVVLFWSSAAQLVRELRGLVPPADTRDGVFVVHEVDGPRHD